MLLLPLLAGGAAQEALGLGRRQVLQGQLGGRRRAQQQAAVVPPPALQRVLERHFCQAHCAQRHRIYQVLLLCVQVQGAAPGK